MNINFHKQAGLSLIELMIASLLGLILMGGVIQVFISSKGTYNVSENMSRAQESGRFAIDVLSRYARVAGYADIDADDITPDPFVDDAVDCDAGKCTRDDDADGINNSDRIAIQSILPNNEDCNGNNGTANRIITNVFWVQDDPNEIPSLYCQGFNNDTGAWMGTAQPYIAGIDSMQALYGVADVNGNITNFVNGTRVADWSSVRAIKISVLAQSAQEDSVDFGTRSYVLLDNPPIEMVDGRPRYIFSTTIFITNTGV